MAALSCGLERHRDAHTAFVCDTSFKPQFENLSSRSVRGSFENKFIHEILVTLTYINNTFTLLLLHKSFKHLVNAWKRNRFDNCHHACDFTGAMMTGFTDAALQVCNTSKCLPQRVIKWLRPLDSHLQFSHWILSEEKKIFYDYYGVPQMFSFLPSLLLDTTTQIVLSCFKFSPLLLTFHSTYLPLISYHSWQKKVHKLLPSHALTKKIIAWDFSPLKTAL